jgi:hypothetical protein
MGTSRATAAHLIRTKGIVSPLRGFDITIR